MPEPKDATFGAVLRSGLALAACAALILWGTSGLFQLLAQREARRDVPPSLLSETGKLPPEPNLQVKPAADLKEVRVEEEELLHGYGWVDSKAELVRIPIGRAMELVAEKGVAYATQERGKKVEPGVNPYE